MNAENCPRCEGNGLVLAILATCLAAAPRWAQCANCEGTGLVRYVEVYVTEVDLR